MKISVLDQSPAREDISADHSIRETISLAQHCEALGYARYWLSEHHNSGSVSGSAPEVLMAAIAATTSRIRIGSAGIMLPHYAALKVAEQFRVLEAIAPGRIDLGLGRAPGSDGRTAMALNPNAASAADNFPAMVRDVQAWTSNTPLHENHPYRTITANPVGPHAPEIWILGSSNYGAQVAAFFGLPYCFAHFFSDGYGTEEALAVYKHQFRPSEAYPKPHCAISVWAFAAETEEEATYHYAPRAYTRLRRERGQYVPFPSPETAAAYPATDTEQAWLTRHKEAAIVGTPSQVGTRLRAMASEFGLDELVITTMAYDEQARRNCLTLLAREFDLSK